MSKIHLIAKYVVKPKNPKLTGLKGYMLQEENIQYDESVYLVKNLKNKDWDAQIILDLGAKKVVKCSIMKGSDYDTLFEYFATSYPRELGPVLKAQSKMAELKAAQEVEPVAESEEDDVST